jgi:RNA polymerase sigma-32 factor
MRRGPLLTRDHEHDLARRAQAGSECARDRLILAHEPLVVAMARSYRGYRVDQEDLVQEGMLGLMRAARDFDAARGLRFSTYARWWVRSAMQEFILRNSSVVGFSRAGARRLLFFGLRTFQRSIAGEGLTHEAVLRRAAEHFALPLDVIREMDQRLTVDLSTNMPIGDGEDGKEYGDLLESAEPSPEEATELAVDTSRLTAAIARATRSMKPRDRAVFKARRLTEEPQTLDAIGQRYGISKERVRQIELRAFDRVAGILTAELAGAV